LAVGFAPRLSHSLSQRPTSLMGTTPPIPFMPLFASFFETFFFSSLPALLLFLGSDILKDSRAPLSYRVSFLFEHFARRGASFGCSWGPETGRKSPPPSFWAFPAEFSRSVLFFPEESTMSRELVTSLGSLGDSILFFRPSRTPIVFFGSCRPLDLRVSFSVLFYCRWISRNTSFLCFKPSPFAPS